MCGYFMKQKKGNKKHFLIQVLVDLKRLISYLINRLSIFGILVRTMFKVNLTNIESLHISRNIPRRDIQKQNPIHAQYTQG